MRLVRFLVVVAFLCSCSPAQADGQDPMTVWNQFVAELKQGKITAEKLRPYDESLRQPMLGFLAIMRQQAHWEEWSNPEVYRVGRQLHYVLPLTFDDGKTTYSFSFLTEGDKWYFQHMESIVIRLDRTGTPPVSVFPDVSEEKKAWIREENAISKDVQLFNVLAEAKGRQFAFDWLKDGAGYVLAAKAWIPMVPVPRAFILYACWEQANLRGNKVTLEALSDTQARVRMSLNYFELYEHAAHIPQQIAFDDYRRIFETIWQDRAEKAGWKLDLACKGAECLFEFKKPAEQAGGKSQ